MENLTGLGRHYLFRPAGLRDVAVATRILRDAAQKMMAEGKCQWTETYPSESNVLSDIKAGNAYVIETDGIVEAYGAMVFTGESAYDDIDGEWLSDSPYVVVHRLAVAQSAQGRGVASRFMKMVEVQAAERGISSFRVDTNFDNRAMLILLEKRGFCYCGEVRYPQGGRMAFEKLI
ncbi:GNAT family N-acetyltransferase [Muribaculaceae bacterium Isolate-037 (Harlan)]|nr:GNAT family N-acetyltransferase [Muribaculaceae bacterium Isolate-037 (Harlan)]